MWKTNVNTKWAPKFILFLQVYVKTLLLTIRNSSNKGLREVGKLLYK